MGCELDHRIALGEMYLHGEFHVLFSFRVLANHDHVKVVKIEGQVFVEV